MCSTWCLRKERPNVYCLIRIDEGAFQSVVLEEIYA